MAEIKLIFEIISRILDIIFHGVLDTIILTLHLVSFM